MMTGFASTTQPDPSYRRLRYVRYADDTLLGFIGPKSEAEEIKRRLAAFLRDDLKLEMSPEKTLITHARKGAATFLGYETAVQHNDRQATCGRRTANGSIALRVPAKVIREKAALYFSRGKPAHRSQLLNDDDYTIVNVYGATGASSSTTYWPAMCADCIGCVGPWKPRCSRHWQRSIARRCPR